VSDGPAYGYFANAGKTKLLVKETLPVVKRPTGYSKAAAFASQETFGTWVRRLGAPISLEDTWKRRFLLGQKS
jgi:hypothetical protein